MLSELIVENLVIVGRAHLRPGIGLTAITGETGAGKSLLLDALDMLTGARVGSAIVGPRGDSASVTAVLVVDAARAALVEAACGVPPEEGAYILRRRVHRSGRGQAWINDTPVTVAALRAAASLLVAIHAQHEPIRFAEPSIQLGLIDAYGGLIAQAEAYRELYRTCHDVARELRAIESGGTASVREAEFLRFQLQELDDLDPNPGELAELEQRHAALSGADAWRGLAEECMHVVAGEDRSLLHQVARLQRRLADAPDGHLSQAAQSMAEVQDTLRQVMDQCGRAIDHLHADPAALAAIEERLNRWNALSRKHADGGDLVDVRAALRERLEGLSGLDAKRDVLRHQLAECQSRLVTTGDALAAARRSVFGRLSIEVHRHLDDLSMPKARLALRDERMPEPGALGTHAQEMLVRTNPGLPPGTIREIASGGEAARLMLAMSAALAEADPIPVLVFDEVDAGVGGRLGGIIGAKLAQLSAGRTVLAVTHTPQLAARAGGHCRVRKHQDEGATWVEVDALDDTSRLAELADMLGGGPAALAQATSLLGTRP